MYRLYLAHPLEIRHEIRRIELEMEYETGVELFNPFYDSHRNDIEKIDSGEVLRDDRDQDYRGIVEHDLELIHKSDGVVAYIKKGIYSIGTGCECWNTLVNTDKPIFVVSPDSLLHPWVRYFIEESNGFGFNSWDTFGEFLKKEDMSRFGGRKCRL